MELLDVPSERTRTEVIRSLRAWFPDIDPLDADQRIKGGPWCLIRNVDESSGERILAALKDFKVHGRLMRTAARGSWWKSLLNPGLALTVPLLALGAILGGWTGLLMLLLAVAAPAAWLLVRKQEATPLTIGGGIGFEYEDWARLAGQYADIVAQLPAADAEILRAIASEIFDLYRRLTSGSLVATIAGEERGYLYERLTEALSTALEMARRVVTAEEAGRGEHRRELVILSDIVKKTGEWFRSLEGTESKGAPAVSLELDQLVERIDRTVRELRQAPHDPLGA